MIQADRAWPALKVSRELDRPGANLYRDRSTWREDEMAGRDTKRDLLKSISIFSACGPNDLAELGQLLDEVDIPDGKLITREGDSAGEMFVIASGRARVERDGRQVAEIGPGDIIGEMALILEGRRNATVTAVGPVKAFVAGHREFHSLMDRHPGFRTRVLEGMAMKVRRLEEHAIS
jgi:CRP/FNR family transcriptional regulator, cyclic AMP receptor protein